MALGLIVCFSAIAHAQPTPAPEFEVASVRPSSPDASKKGSGGYSGSGRLIMTNVTLKRCIMGAYGLGQNEIIGGPDWLDQDQFDIQAKAGEKAGGELIMKMLQTLLADRFKLAIHRENKVIPAYVLEVAKNGPKLEKSGPGESKTSNGRGLIDARNTTMSALAERLGRQLDRPVIDRTGLDGEFNFKLEWTPDDAKAQKLARLEVPSADGPTVFAAIQQQLGLKLDPQKAPVQVLLIDHAEKPTEN